MPIIDDIPLTRHIRFRIEVNGSPPLPYILLEGKLVLPIDSQDTAYLDPPMHWVPDLLVQIREELSEKTLRRLKIDASPRTSALKVSKPHMNSCPISSLINTSRAKLDYRNTLRYSLKQVEEALEGISSTPPGSQDAQFTRRTDVVTEMRMFAAQWTQVFRQPDPPSEIEKNRIIVSSFEEDLWGFLKLEGVLVPEVLFKECQKKFSEVQSQFLPTLHDIDFQERSLEKLVQDPVFLEKCLDLLGKLHQQRKISPFLYKSPLSEGNWTSLKSSPPNDEMRKIGPRFWALIIGNDKYPQASRPLSGCVNDANLIRDYLKKYLGVTNDHIRFLTNASRSAIINNLYDLRDDRCILPGDNILIHFSGHGTSYDARQYFTGTAASKGSIEAICPIDRGPTVPDISDRELNSILLEIMAEKGQNITVTLDCCHAGGALRNEPQGPGFAPRYLEPLRTEGNLDLRLMLNAGDNNERRGRYTPFISYEVWNGDFDGIVQLASCHDFQVAREADYYHSNGPSHPVERVNVGFNSTLQKPALPDVNGFDEFDFPRGRLPSNVKGKANGPSQRPPMSHLPTASMPAHTPPSLYSPSMLYSRSSLHSPPSLYSPPQAERVNIGSNSTLQKPALPDVNGFDEFDFPRGRPSSNVKGKANGPSPRPPMSHLPTAYMPAPIPPSLYSPPSAPPTVHRPPQFPTPAPPPYYEQPMIQPSSPRYGCFTWALVKVLESEVGRNGTYESVIASIGKLSATQVPVLLGRRKGSRLWYRE